MKRASGPLCALGIVVAAAAVIGRAAEPSEPPSIGHPAPAFSLKTLGGKDFNLADQRGQLVVLHFGAGW